MYALNLDKETGRILSATLAKYAPADAVIVGVLPDGNITDYLYLDGVYFYSPLPKPDNTVKAPRNIVVGEYITINGVMYKAISNIPNGGAIITGQNAVETTIEAELLILQQKGE